jgi:hypothetical protein
LLGINVLPTLSILVGKNKVLSGLAAMGYEMLLSAKKRRRNQISPFESEQE